MLPSLRTAALALLLLGLATSSVMAADDLLIADFEGDSYGDWKVEGQAFGSGPAKGMLPGQMGVSGFEGKGLVNSFTGGDGTTGKLTSPPFKIERDFLNFLIGGGAHPGETCINLLVGDQLVKTSTGPNESSGGSEQLEWTGWDVKSLKGKQAVIEIVDTHTGGWGHINIDQIHQSDTSRIVAPRERQIAATERYLLLPVKTGATKRRIQVLADEKVLRDFEIELADGDADFWVASDLGPWQGQTVTVRAAGLPQNSTQLEQLKSSAAAPTVGDGNDPRRPEIHFTAPRGWLNDPNGLVQADGVWHLFYQHNPYGWNWGNMHWGHAISRDLLHWDHQPIALVPQKFGDWAFSGSALIDTDNTSGWGSRSEPAMVAAYTSTGRGECMVYSTDQGQTWTEFEGNPVVKHEGRDPRLLWHAPTKRWVMAVYDEAQGKRWISFYTSSDLKAWDFASKIEGFFECPDLFELPVEGQPGAAKWVLYAADGEYVLGQFDGREFKADGGKHRLWFGNFYAAQTFSNVADGRRIQIGWGQGIEFPDQPFNQQMTIPVELKLVATPDGPRMTATPVRELDAALKPDASKDVALSSAKPLDVEGPDGFLQASVSLPAKGKGQVRVELRGVPVVIDLDSHTIKVADAPQAPWNSPAETLAVRLLVDRGSVEAFVGQGLTAVSARANPRADSPAVHVTRTGDPIDVRVTVSELTD